MLEILDIHHTLLEPLQVKSKGLPTNEIRTKTSFPSYFQTFFLKSQSFGKLSIQFKTK